jgi:hypothetical protein
MPGLGVIENKEWGWVIFVSTILLILLLLPYLWAYGLGTGGLHFVGVLVNPLDGLSYLAKMWQGYTGEWLFRLAYTPEPHQGVFLYTFYLGLGHLARLMGLPVVQVYHLARILGSLLMFLALYRFVADWTDDVTQRRLAWAFGVLGAGFGWISLLFGYVSPDLLSVPEAFPFQAALTNAHFPWAIATLLILVHVLAGQALDEEGRTPDFNIETIVLAICTLFIVVIAPYLLIPVGVAYGVLLAWLWARFRAFPARQFAWGGVVLLFALPLIAYGIWAVSPANPVFNTWMHQNQTPSPPVWAYLIAFGPFLILAGLGVWGIRHRLGPGDLFLLVWFAASAVLLYAPFGLQRRFTMGMIAPLVIYAGAGLWRNLIPRFFPRMRVLGIVLAFSIFLPTTLVDLVAPMPASQRYASSGGGLYYLSQDEIEAMSWLSEQAAGSLVLASPEMSAFLPTRGLRVVYAHPYETLRAEEREAEVLSFFAGENCRVLEAERVDYVLVGPRERALTGGEMCPAGSSPVFESDSGGVLIYAADGQ